MFARFILTLLACMILVGPVQAGKLSEPVGEVILNVTGAIAHNNKAGAAVFDRAMLEKIDWQTVKTETRWHDGMVTFEGPSGKGFLKEIGVSDPNATLRVIALNDYAVDMPAKDFMETGLILAMKKDGKFMGIRDKGPLFIIYPFTGNKQLQDDIYYSRSVWQIKAIHVKK